jgi:transcriptional regulator with XRE-family HTH domain
LASVGYRGKVVEQQRARELRAQGWTYAEIEAELGVSRSSVSVWVRDVEVDDVEWARRVRRNKNFGARRRAPNRLQLAKQDEIDRCRREAADWLGPLSERDLLVAGIALYAGEGFKTGGAVGFANTDPRMIALFLRWLRTFFDIEESRLRLRLYLHDNLDLDAAYRFWSELTAIPVEQFGAPYRAADDPSRRKARHPMGCPAVRYSSISTLRSVLALVDSLVQCSVPSPG